MKRFSVLLLLHITIFSTNLGYAQTYNLETANQQEVFLQFNRPFYLSGEKLWFSLFNYDSQTGKLLQGKRFMELTLLDKEAKVILQKRIKIENGKSDGQFILPSSMATNEYVIHLGYLQEAVNQFVYRTKIKVYNRAELQAEAMEKKTIFSFEDNLPSPQPQSKGISATLAQNTYGTTQTVSVDLSLTDAKSASLSVLVKPAKETLQQEINEKAGNYLRQNFRAVKPLKLAFAKEHPYLTLYVKLNTELTKEARPLIYIPETQQAKAFFNNQGNVYAMDLTDVSGGERSFYFNEFVYKPFIPSDAVWDYEKEKYKDNLVPHFQSEINLTWEKQEQNFSSILQDITFKTPEVTEVVLQYTRQQTILEAMFASGGYEGIPIAQESQEVNLLTAPTLYYKEAANFEQMNTVGEFLFEIVQGIRVWDNETRKDVRVLFGGEAYHDTPLFLVDGIPTRDVEKVLGLPIADVKGGGIIKFQETQGKLNYKAEARSFSDFAGSGIVVLHLNPGASNPFRSTYEDMLSTHLYIEPERYPNPIYTDENKEKAPDLRKTLLWTPTYLMNKKKEMLTFFTSDVPGEYEIVVQGITSDGEKVMLRQSFSVAGEGK